MFKHMWQGTWRGGSPAGDVHLRAREVISPSGGIVRGKFPSRKNGRMVHHEGMLELDAIYLFETSPRIAAYREQPTTIQYPDGDRLRRYTPDFELTLATGEFALVEVKHTRNLADGEVRHKLDCIAAHLQRSARSFVILTDVCLRLEPRQTNLRALYHRAPRVQPTLHACRIALDRHGNEFPMTIEYATTLLAPRAIDPYSLLLAGLLYCDLDTPICGETELHLAEGSDDAWFHIAQGRGF
ncbi:TnsA endonuclease N-terminal domain-containing protein [Collimonas humicola]|uniref:TnsA endonuclease N-terminal domain-containing protein n=1 Tax=Collimonas humicola TaxID=2825886 RepID=UPI001E33BFBB|nr:TnsA endonuclease N-terminal domain-containing protein [Collimonas humicola]